MNTFFLVVKALAILIPYVINLIRDGEIRTGAQDEVITALENRVGTRLIAANAAKQGDLADEDTDPNNRNNFSVG